MKKLITAIFLLISLVSEAQVPISGLPTYTGDPYGGWIPVVLSGVTRKTASQNLGNLDSISVATGSTYDTLKVFKNSVLKYYKLVRAGSTLDTTSIYSAIGLKLNISDTTNKWITSVYRKTGTDSVFVVKGGTHSFAFKDSTGGGGGSTDTSKWTINGSTIYPKSRRYLVLGDSGVTAAAPLHFIQNTDVKELTVLQPRNYNKVYPAGGGYSYGGKANRWSSGITQFNNWSTDGRPNVVYYHGYNAAAGGARIDTSDAGYQFREESHYWFDGSGPWFELHLPESYSKNGLWHRHWSFYINKQNGYTDLQSQVELHTYFTKEGTGFYKLSRDSAEDATRLRLQSIDSFGTQYFQMSAINSAFGDLSPFQITNNFYSTTFSKTNSTLLPSYISFAALNLDLTDQNTVNNDLRRVRIFANSPLTSQGQALFGDGGLVPLGIPSASKPDTSAQLELRSISKGFLPSRMTGVQMAAIVTPATGLFIYNTDSVAYCFYNGSAWTKLAAATGGVTSFATAYTATATGITLDGTHHTVNVTATGQTITLPTAVGITGRIYTIKLTASGTGTVATTSSQTIDGSTTYSLSAQYKYVTVQSDGTNWIIIANN